MEWKGSHGGTESEDWGFHVVEIAASLGRVPNDGFGDLADFTPIRFGSSGGQ